MGELPELHTVGLGWLGWLSLFSRASVRYFARSLTGSLTSLTDWARMRGKKERSGRGLVWFGLGGGGEDE